jgi:hypothetical protein
VKAHETPFLEFSRALRQGKKTERWDVFSKEHARKEDCCAGDELGTVQWGPMWRRYAFFPKGQTLFDARCLRDLAAFCDRLMAERRRP